MMEDKYARAMNDLNSYLLDILDEGILTKEDILMEVENVFGERVSIDCLEKGHPEYEKS